MSIQWGKWGGNAPNRVRLGAEFTAIPTPAAAATTALVKGRILLQSEKAFTDNSNFFTYSGSLGSKGSHSIPITAGANSVVVLKNLSKSVPIKTSGTTPLTLQAAISGLGHVGQSNQMEVKATDKVPARGSGGVVSGRPDVVPSPNVMKVEDKRQRLGWGNPGGPNWPRSYVVGRHDFYSSGSAYTVLGTTKNRDVWYGGTQANRRYSYRVAAQNEFGQGPYTYFPNVYTTPAKPNWSVAKRRANSIDVLWVNYAPWATHFDIERSSNGGTWTARASVPISAGLKWTDSAPNLGQTHRYRIRARIGTTIFSAWDYTATVLVAVPPLAPNLLAPANGLVRERPASGATAFLFKWGHNTVDSSEQTAAQHRYRLNGGGWNTYTIGGSAEEVARNISLGSSSTLEWQVRTRGVDPSYGPWSGIFKVVLATKPVFTFTQPVDNAVVEGNQVEVKWTYFEADGNSQSSVYLELGVPDEAPVGSWTVPGSANVFLLPVRIPESSGYILTGYATSSKGIKSDEDQIAFSVRYDRPATPEMDAEWIPDEFCTKLQIRAVEALKWVRINRNPTYEVPPVTILSSPDGFVYRGSFNAPDGSHVIGGVSLINGTYKFEGSGYYRVQFKATHEPGGAQILVNGNIIRTLHSGYATTVDVWDGLSPDVTIQVSTGLPPSNDNMVRIWDFRIMQVPDEFAASSTYERFDETTHREDFYYGLNTFGQPYEAVAVPEGTGDVPVLTAVASRIERSDDNGLTWYQHSWLDNLEPTAEVIDWLTPLNQVVEYRPVAISELPSEAIGDPRSVFTESQSAVFSMSSDITDYTAFDCDLTLPSTLSDYTQTHVFSGRELPVNIYDLDHKPFRTVAFNGTLPKTWVGGLEETLAKIQSENVYYRDFRGRFFWASVTGAGVDPFHGHPIVTASVKESDNETIRLQNE